MTQKDLADMLSITDKAVSKWERDIACPDTQTIPKLAEILGISVEELMNAKSVPASGHKGAGYPDVRAFMATYRKAEAVVEQYNRELAEWERKANESRRPAEKERYAPPEKQSVRDQLRRLQAEDKQPKPKRRSHDRER